MVLCSEAHRLTSATAADLVPLHGLILCILERPYHAVQRGRDCCLCLGYVFFEGFVPAKLNEGRDDQNFSQ